MKQFFFNKLITPPHFLQKNYWQEIQISLELLKIPSFLTFRFADMFTTEEILKIERQSIQSRLFSHLALNLATGTMKSNHAIYISANTLFRCTSCSLILTRECCLYVPCTFGKFTALQSGKIVYRHSR